MRRFAISFLPNYYPNHGISYHFYRWRHELRKFFVSLRPVNRSRDSAAPQQLEQAPLRSACTSLVPDMTNERIIQIDSVDAYNKLYGWETLHPPLNCQHRPPESLFRLYLYIKALWLPPTRFRGNYRRSRSFGSRGRSWGR